MSYSRLYTMVRYKAIYYVVYCLSDSMFVCLSASNDRLLWSITCFGC